MWKLFIANLKMIVRNKEALFWSFMFPLMFTFIFGLFFGKNSSVGTIGIVDNANTEISNSLVDTIKESEIFSVKDYDELSEAKDQINKSSISAIIYINEAFSSQSDNADNTIKILYDQGSAQVGSVITSFVEKFLSQVGYNITNTQPIFNVISEKISDREMTYFDFVLAGVLGLALMNSSIHGIAVGMSKYREDKILKRITTTPLKSWVFVSAEVLSRIVLNLVQISIILIVGKYIFSAHIYGNVFIIYAVSMVAAILFQLIGFMIASFCNSTNAAEGMATAITIPMMFLSGVFFPIDSLPNWLYMIVQYLPLAPLLRIIRGVTLEGISPFSNFSYVIIIISWIIASLLISVYRFKLSDE